VGLLSLVALGPCAAAPPKSPVPLSATTSPAAVPDYGGRDAPGLLAGAGTAAPDPAAQAGRALLSLVLVLGGVFGVVTLLKRGGYTGGGPVGTALIAGLQHFSMPSSQKTIGNTPVGTSGPLSLLQSQSLPGGGAVHLLSVQDRTLILVGATAQGVSLIAEWEPEDQTDLADTETMETASNTDANFQDFLARADLPPSPVEHVRVERLSDLLSNQRIQSREGTRE
jgi:hypothetical protein